MSIIKSNNFLTSSFFCNRKKIESHKSVCENKGFCIVTMPSEGTKILKFNQYQKSEKSAEVSEHIS